MIPHLGHLLALEARTHAPDGAGGYAPTWVPLGHVWAQIVVGDARETEQPGATVATRPLRIIVRGAVRGSLRRPLAGQRFRQGDRVYSIASVREADEGGRFLLCRAFEEWAT